MIYQDVYLSLDEALPELDSGEPDRMVVGLLAISMQEVGFDLAQQRALEFTASPDERLRGIGVLCLGHIVRVYKTLDLVAAERAVARALTDESDFVRGHAESARDDIAFFLRPSVFAGSEP